MFFNASCIQNMLTHLVTEVIIECQCIRVGGIRFFFFCSRSAGAPDVSHFSWLWLPLSLFISLPPLMWLSTARNGMYALDGACLRVGQGAMCSVFFWCSTWVDETLGAAQKHSFLCSVVRLWLKTLSVSLPSFLLCLSAFSASHGSVC